MHACERILLWKYDMKCVKCPLIQRFRHIFAGREIFIASDYLDFVALVMQVGIAGQSGHQP